MKSSILLLSSVCLCAVLPARAQQVSEQVSESRSYLQFFDAITADRAANQQDVKVEHIETAAKGNDARKPIMSMPVTVDPNAGTSERQHAYLKTAGLSENEAVMAQVVLSKFRIQYDALVAEYNNLPETLAGTNDATPAFLSRLENLTQSTKYSLGKLLSAEGMVNLDRSIPRVSIKTASVYVPEKAQVISAAFHPGSAGQIVDGGCTLTSHYTATTTLSAAFNNSISLTTQILASSTTSMSGYASVSGSCGGLIVSGHESNYLGVGTIGESDPNCTIRVSITGLSPTSWLSLNNVVERFESVGQPAVENWNAWIGVTGALALLFNAVDSKWHEFAYTRTIEPYYYPRTNCSIPTGRVCDFVNEDYCINTPDMHITSVRYDWTLDGLPPALVGWEVWGEVFSLTGHQPWTGGTNLLQFAWPPYYSAKGLGNCTYHP